MIEKVEGGEKKERSSERRRDAVETPCKAKRSRGDQKCELTNYKERR